jgi:hypothetical protein
VLRSGNRIGRFRDLAIEFFHFFSSDESFILHRNIQNSHIAILGKFGYIESFHEDHLAILVCCKLLLAFRIGT